VTGLTRALIGAALAPATVPGLTLLDFALDPPSGWKKGPPGWTPDWVGLVVQLSHFYLVVLSIGAASFVILVAARAIVGRKYVVTVSIAGALAGFGFEIRDYLNRLAAYPGWNVDLPSVETVIVWLGICTLSAIVFWVVAGLDWRTRRTASVPPIAAGPNGI